MQFDIIGYSKDYYIDYGNSGNKYIGSVRLNDKDRKLCGYEGRKFKTTTKDIVLDNGRKIKEGTEVWTMIVELNGKLREW